MTARPKPLKGQVDKPTVNSSFFVRAKSAALVENARLWRALEKIIEPSEPRKSVYVKCAILGRHYMQSSDGLELVST